MAYFRMKYYRLGFLLPGLFALICGVSALADEGRSGPPNLILIFVDDLGYGELGAQGNRQIPTPHIDSLAAEGVRFTQGYVTASYCSPSRAGIMTGRYQTRFGYEHNPVGRHNLDPDAGLPPEEVTLAEHLKQAGYATALIGKWHLGARPEVHPLSQGFDEFYGFLHEGHFYKPPPYEGLVSFLRTNQLPDSAGSTLRRGNTVWSTHTGRNEPPYDEDNPVLKGREPVADFGYLTDELSRRAAGFIERRAGEPFFLYLSYSAVHSPMQATLKKMRRFEGIEDLHRRVFAGMLSDMDDGVGLVLERLRRLGLEEETLIFFISDNGGITRELTSSNAPLRGGKGDYYEGGIRVPFMARWKGRIPAGLVYKKPVISLDVFATASALAGLELPEGRAMDGVDLLPYLTGRKAGAPHETLFWRAGRKTALRHGEWKIVRNRRNEEAGFELYHLSEDLSETRNLAGDHPEKLEALTQLWGRFNGEMKPPKWVPGWLKR